jgi:UDP-N-acetylmuramyl pentapeptide phosphotransferase/UDP-N-acetylglucosamine-1-phosphate transferase
VVSVNAVCVSAEAFMGYFVVLEDQEMGMVARRDSLKAGVCLLSLIQVALIVCYWITYVNYLEAVQLALSPGSVIEKGLGHSPKMIGCCLAEAVFCLFTFYPGILFQVHSLSSVIEWSSDDLSYIFILLRSYQAGRLLYWLCPFSDMRTHIFARVTTVQHSSGFVMRCLVARFGFLLLAILCVFLVLVLGVMECVFERHNSDQDMDVIWNEFWLSAYTVTAIGYGHLSPKTVSGQVFIVFCTFFGALILGFLTTVSSNSLNLSLRESDMYSNLLYARHKENFDEEAILTLQRWWKFMKMRLSKKPNGPTVIRFYTQLRAYRATLVACQRGTDTLFERQIAAFDHSTHSRFRNLSEYLQPTHNAYPLLQDIYRNEYRIKSLCRGLYKLTRRYKVGPQLKHASDTSILNEIQTTSSSQAVAKSRFGQKAKAKLNAYQNVVSRLAREEARAR